MEIYLILGLYFEHHKSNKKLKKKCLFIVFMKQLHYKGIIIIYWWNFKSTESKYEDLGKKM